MINQKKDEKLECVKKENNKNKKTIMTLFQSIS